MKKGRLAALVLAAALLAACGDGPKGIGTGGSAPAVQSTPAPAPTQAPVQPAEEGLPPLRELMSSFMANGDDPDGFYMMDNPQNDRYTHLMYYDYNTLQQRYVCDVPGCTHQDESCPCTFRTTGGTYAFAQGDYMFISFGSWDDGSGWDNHENWPSALVRFDRDAKNPQVMLTDKPYYLQLDSVYGDGEALYINHWDEGFLRVDVESFEKTVLLPPGWNKNEETGVRTQVMGTYGGQLLCRRYRILDRNEPWEMLGLLLLEPRTGEETPLHAIPDDAGWPRGFAPDGLCYYVDPPTAEIRSLNLETGEEALISDMLCAKNRMYTRTVSDSDGRLQEEPFHAYEGWSILPSGDWLIMQGYDAEADRQATLSYNLATGESYSIGFTNYHNGGESSMFILTDTPRGLLVIEDRPTRIMHSTGTGGDPTSFPSEYWVFALITADDFARDVPSFHTIQPVPYSGA